VLSSKVAAMCVAGSLIAAPPAVAGDRAPAEGAPAPTGPVADVPVVKLETHGTLPGRNARLVPRDQWLWVRGTLVSPANARTVDVEYVRRGRVVKRDTNRIRRGGFVSAFRSGRAGRVTVRVRVHTPAGQARLASRRLQLRVVGVPAAFGSRGEIVRAVQGRLKARGYVVPRSGVLDAGTGRAILAFRKMLGMPRNMVLTSEIASKLARGYGGFRPRYPNHGKHAEADISRQILVLLRGSKPVAILHTSSGAPATPTIRGNFRVYRKDYGYNSLGMLHSVYFIRGYAVHGFASVPIYPASHGCLRIPNANALWVYRWFDFGDRVDTYL
jgi:hypothetical protein